MYNIEKQIIPGLPRRKLTASRFIVAHEAGNPENVGPDSLEREIRYMKNNWKTAFTSHFVGGGGQIVQLAPAGWYQYGAGPPANALSYAQVELARTKDRETFLKDYAAYVWLLRHLADEAGIPKTFDAGSTATNRGIKSHDWIRKHVGGTTHTDPFAYLASHGISRAQFKHDVEKGLEPYKVAGSIQTAKLPPYVLGVATVNQNMNLRAAPDASAEIVGSVPSGSAWRVLESEGGWYRVSANAWLSNKNGAYAVLVKNQNYDPNFAEKEQKRMEDIEKLTARIATLEKQLNTQNDPVSPDAADDWKEASANGYYDKTRPRGFMRREEDSIVTNRIRHNFLNLISKQNEKIEALEKELADIKAGILKLNEK